MADLNLSTLTEADIITKRVLPAILDQGQENAFGETVLDFAVYRVGHVLLDGMDEGVNHAVRDLARRQGIGINRGGPRCIMTWSMC